MPPHPSDEGINGLLGGSGGGDLLVVPELSHEACPGTRLCSALLGSTRLGAQPRTQHSAKLDVFCGRLSISFFCFFLFFLLYICMYIFVVMATTLSDSTS